MKYHHYIQSGNFAGRILRTIEHDLCIESILARDGETDVTHYVAWEAIEASGRPIEPKVKPRLLLVPEVLEEEGKTTVSWTSETGLDVRLDGALAGHPEPEAGKVVLELVSRIPRSFQIEIDMVDRYSPRQRVQVR